VTSRTGLSSTVELIDEKYFEEEGRKIAFALIINIIDFLMLESMS
jgi:hypothetical protein